MKAGGGGFVNNYFQFQELRETITFKAIVLKVTSLLSVERREINGKVRENSD